MNVVKIVAFSTSKIRYVYDHVYIMFMSRQAF